jgi:fermentation-respiration switch protein FrsA (DUF1100 family)
MNAGKIVRPACALLIGAAAIFFMLRQFEHSQVYQPSADFAADPRDLRRAFEDVFIPVDREQIHAWYFPAGHANPPGRQLAVLVCHGNAGNISHRLDLAALLLEARASVLLFDYRGYGRSSGRPSEQATYQDAQAAYGWLRRKGFAPASIVAYGESLGGGVVSELALREPLAAIILQNTFTSMPDIASELFPWLPVRWVGAIKYDTCSKLPRIKIPVLILHSRQDHLIGFRHARKNFAAANSPKYLCEIGGGHNDGLYVTRPQFLEGIKKFLQSLP